MYQGELQLLARVGIAALLGAALGLEREIKDKPAGLRTHMLVAAAAALLVGLGQAVVSQYYAGLGGQLVRSDPTRIIEAVITGVSFLGAGTILRRGRERQVEGLTTAASLLIATGIGISVAMSHMVTAIGATVIALIVLRGVRLVEGWIQTLER
jgi:putative Mg2+ transporter-C (MgtC) family protein